jgi:hypothetical protein
VGEQLADQHAVVGELEAVGERLAQQRDLRPQPTAGELGQLVRVADAVSSASSIARAETE